MNSTQAIDSALLLAVGLLLVLLVGLIIGFLLRLRRRRAGKIGTVVGADTATTGSTASDAIESDGATAAAAVPVPETDSVVDIPESSTQRMVRFRQCLAGSKTLWGKGLLAIVARDRFDDDTWQDLEDVLIGADVGVSTATRIVQQLREKTKILGVADHDQVRALLAEQLIVELSPDSDRTVQVGESESPSALLMVGVNGVGKTTTCGKLARLLVSGEKKVLLGAADTFRAAAAEQLTTWGQRVNVPVIRGEAGADPASVAFDAASKGKAEQVNVVIIDTAGRLHTKVGLMDELSKVKRVVEKQLPVTEVLLVLDATTGQNGLTQAKIFSEVVPVTGVVITKLDGSAKGGIVIAVQQQLGVPVKLVGIGEGPDDLVAFSPDDFVQALLS